MQESKLGRSLNIKDGRLPSHEALHVLSKMDPISSLVLLTRCFFVRRKHSAEAHLNDFLDLLDTVGAYIQTLEQADDVHASSIMVALEQMRPLFINVEEQNKGLENAITLWLPLLKLGFQMLGHQRIIDFDNSTTQPVSTLALSIRNLIVRRTVAGDGQLSDFLKPLDLA